ncbi:MAG: glycosyltransferase family 4 protein [Acidobacteria bacterium]|nr:glycosyltransferase family 4 protein [Acidobacteriota bacterium]
MKILQVSSATAIGGGEVHVIDLCQTLVQRGHEMHLAVRPQSPLVDRLASQPVTVHPLALRNSLDVGSARRIGHLIRHHQIDIIHGHVARDYLVCVMARKLAGRGKLVLTRHHYLPIKGTWGYRHMFGQVGKFIAVSEYVRSGLIASLKLPPNHVVTIPNWVNLERFQDLPDCQYARGRFGVKERFVVGMVGQITPAKGQEEFVRAAAHVASLRDDVLFLIAGEEQGRTRRFTEYLRRLAGELRLGERLWLIGQVEELPLLFAALTVLVVPSWFEAFSITLIQAMAAGLPVIASNIGGPAEIVTHRATGWLVPPGEADALAEAIAYLLDDPDLRDRLSAAGREEVQARFERERVIDQIEAVYQELLTQGREFLVSHP